MGASEPGVGLFSPQAPAAGSDAIARAQWTFCALAIIVGAATAVYFYSLRNSLWEDEIIAITHANQAFPLFFVEVLRNDIHPPLYFLQLAAWIALGTNTDAWALANSVVWAALALIAVFFVTRGAHGARAAWFATALFAVLPSFAWSAGTLRMYAAIPACVLLVYHVNRRWFVTREPKLLTAILVVEVLSAWVHAIEFYFVAFIALGAFLEGAAAGRLRLASFLVARPVRIWMVVQAIFCISILPIVASALMRSSDASAPDSAIATLSTVGSLIAGWKFSAFPWARVAGGIVLILLIGVALRDRTSRWRTLAIPVGALLVAMVVALVLKPLFKQPVFAANLLPFVVLGAGAAAAHARSARGIVIGCIAILAIAAFPIVQYQRQAEGYADAGRMIARGVRPGDVVVAPSVSVYWGVMRYAVGPRWGEPLRIMSAPNPQWTRMSERVSKAFGPDSVARLGLVPERNFVDYNGVRYLLGGDAIAESQAAQHVWVVTRKGYAVDVSIDPRLVASEVTHPETFGNGELLVQRFDRPSSR